MFGCTRKHAPDDCPTFLDMTPKERLDLVHMKQLCLLCLGHPMNVGCEAMGRGPNCTVDGCSKPHHEMLHGVLKAGESSLPARGIDPPDEPAATTAADKAPDLVRQLGGLLESLGIDPDALEVRIGVRRPGEQGRSHGGGSAIGSGAMETGEGKLTGGLLETLSLLCQAGVKFMSCMGESQQRMIKSADPAVAPGRDTQRERGRPVVRDMGCVPGRDGGKAAGSRPAVQGDVDDAGSGSEDGRGTENGPRAWGRGGCPKECEGLRRVVVLTPEGGQLINVGVGGGFEFSVVSQRTAAGYGVERTKLQTPLMLEGPSGAPTRGTEICTIAFPQERAVGGKMMIFAFVVDALEEYCEMPHGGLQRWQMQLGADNDGFLPWLRVAQPGDRPWCELTLDSVTLSPEGVSRSTWGFLVCKGWPMTETVWLTAARAWSMPVSRISAEAAVRLGLTGIRMNGAK